MSSLQYAIVENETETAITNVPVRPYLVPQGQADSAPLTRRVEAALDADFAHGSMPA
jgi:hypothetical protein